MGEALDHHERTDNSAPTVERDLVVGHGSGSSSRSDVNQPLLTEAVQSPALLLSELPGPATVR
jgi:hypothetical protein